MITLRELQIKDAPLMLEWMHDPDNQKAFKKNMISMTQEEAEAFIKSSRVPSAPKQGESIHFAIADEEDEYLGTISLKDIDLKNKTAEYAIATRKKAQGRGVAFAATDLLLNIAFKEYGLHRVYLNVLADNTKAIHLYEKCGFTLEGEFREHLKIGDTYVNWKWYGMLKNEFYK